jgi:glycosyltransferase involved in cell wall biosynthesis
MMIVLAEKIGDKMKKNVWILNHYATGQFYDKGGRHFWISEQLKKRGYAPVVFGASYLRTDENKVDLEGKKFKVKKTGIGVPLIVVKVCSEKDGGIHRIKNMMDYYRNVQCAAKKYAEKYGKPDIIYASSVHPLALIAGEKLAKKYHVPCICEVRDLWPETMVLMGIWKKNMLTNMMYMGERWIYKKADALVFTMEGAAEYIKSRKWDKASGGPIDLNKIYHINNGVDLKRFMENVEKYSLNDDDLAEDGKFIVNYTGSIRAANSVDELVGAAQQLKELHNERVKILIWGTGNYVENLCELIRDSGLNNIKYKGMVKKAMIPSVLSQGDVNVYTFRDGGTKYGIDLNKCFEYLASGKPLIGNDDTLFSVIRKYDCGIEKKMNARELGEAIDKISNMPVEEYERLCKNASMAAEDYDFSVLTAKLIDIIEQL